MRRRYIIAVLLLGTAIPLSGIVSAQSQAEWRATEDTEKPKTQMRTGYTGVKPGEGNPLPRVEELKTKTGNWVTWPGFVMQPGGGSRVFLQSTGELGFDIQEKKNRITLKFDDVQVFLSNNRNPLVTTHFNTPLKRAYLKKRGKKVELILELRISSTQEISQFTDEDGYHYLFIDFPAGDYPMPEQQSLRTELRGYGRPVVTTPPPPVD